MPPGIPSGGCPLPSSVHLQVKPCPNTDPVLACHDSPGLDHVTPPPSLLQGGQLQLVQLLSVAAFANIADHLDSPHLDLFQTKFVSCCVGTNCLDTILQDGPDIHKVQPDECGAVPVLHSPAQ